MPTFTVEIEIPAEWQDFRLPEGVHHRLQELLDRQDEGQALTPAERKEAEGLVELAEWLLLLRLKASAILLETQRITKQAKKTANA